MLALQALFAAHPDSVLFLLRATAERRPLALVANAGQVNTLVDFVACSSQVFTSKAEHPLLA